MDSLIFFITWGGLLFLMMRFVCGPHVMGHGSKEGEIDGRSDRSRWVPPKSDFDPVCDKAVRPEEALSCVHDGHVYYFCGAECREAFEAAPEHYLSINRTPPTAAIEVSNA